MPQFLLEHMDGCTPFEPCVSCQGLAMLRKKLSEPEMKRFLELMRGASAKQEVRHVALGQATTREPVNLDQPWDDVLDGLPNRIRYCLRNQSLVSLRDVVKMEPDKVRSIPNFGKVSYNRLVEELATHGLYLGMEVPEKKPDPLPQE